MKITPPDPLSSEERALATMLARVAPHGVPSPEIDASILSASHDAVAGNAARAARPRWPVAMGVAASMVLAVGVAWQLRTAPPGAGDLEAASAKVLSSIDEPAASAPAVKTVSPSTPPNEATGESAAAPPRKSVERPIASQQQVADPGVAGVIEVPRSAPAAALPAPVQAPPPPPAPPAPAYPASPQPASPMGAVERKPASSAGIQRLEAPRQADTVASSDSASDATTPARRELRVAPTSERVQEDALPPSNSTIRARRTDLQVPVAADAQLQPGDWLERVRTRYGLGDEDAARRSLLLFVQDHPTESVPGDLKPLLDE